MLTEQACLRVWAVKRASPVYLGPANTTGLLQRACNTLPSASPSSDHVPVPSHFIKINSIHANEECLQSYNLKANRPWEDSGRQLPALTIQKSRSESCISTHSFWVCLGLKQQFIFMLCRHPTLVLEPLRPAGLLCRQTHTVKQTQEVRGGGGEAGGGGGLLTYGKVSSSSARRPSSCMLSIRAASTFLALSSMDRCVSSLHSHTSGCYNHAPWSFLVILLSRKGYVCWSSPGFCMIQVWNQKQRLHWPWG